MTTPPFKTPPTPSTSSADHWVRLTTVGLPTLLPSQYLSRSRMAGGERRLGTDSIYMAAPYSMSTALSSTITPFTWLQQTQNSGHLCEKSDAWPIRKKEAPPRPRFGRRRFEVFGKDASITSNVPGLRSWGLPSRSKLQQSIIR